MNLDTATPPLRRRIAAHAPRQRHLARMIVIMPAIAFIALDQRIEARILAQRILRDFQRGAW